MGFCLGILRSNVAQLSGRKCGIISAVTLSQSLSPSLDPISWASRYLVVGTFTLIARPLTGRICNH